MRPFPKLALFCAALALSGCSSQDQPPPLETPMPPNTVLLSQMMRELSDRPGFTDSLVAQIDKGGKKGPALLTPELIDELRTEILGKNWEGLDRFPGWTMREIDPTVRIAGHIAGKDQAAENLAAAHPGAAPTDARAFLDLGPYTLDTPQSVSLDEPSTLPGFTTDGIVSDLGNGVTRGDGPNALAPEHPESQRLADALNRLAANKLDGAAPFAVTINGATAQTPQDLIAALAAAGNSVTVNDARYFANFGHFHYTGRDVMMPFWVNSRIIIPHSGGRPLLVPVSHAELEWHIHGPKINADVSYYFGIDGKSEWRTMDTLDQAWVLKRNAHAYTGQQALEATRLAGLLTVAYMHLHAAHPALPFGGYYALGVCQDGVSAIEKHITGAVTLFPNTADASFFKDPRDPEVNALIAAIPKDRDGKPPTPERIFGSLPADPGTDFSFSSITIPGLASDLAEVHRAWTDGTLMRPRTRPRLYLIILGLIVIAVAGISINRRRNIDDFENI